MPWDPVRYHFRQQVKQRFVVDGYLEKNIQLAWMELRWSIWARGGTTRS